jgi:hypothetical protein
VAEKGIPMRRYKTIGNPSDPLTTSNVLIATEGPHQKTDILGEPINPCRKPWSVVADFLYQFGNGGLIFSMMDGLSPTSLAAIHLGDYDVIAFEANREMWLSAQEAVGDFLQQHQKRQRLYMSGIRNDFEVCSIFFNYFDRFKN